MLAHQMQKLTRSGRTLCCFVRFVTRRFFIDGGIYRAAALTFTTLLAIVPFMSVVFFVLAAFPAFKAVNQQLQKLAFEHFVPASGETVQQYLQQFVEQATTLSWSGVTFLVLSALAMLFTIEQAMNHIWRTRLQQRGASAFLLYWAILTLGPLLIGVSFLASSYLLSLPWMLGASEGAELVVAGWLASLPWLIIVVAFTLLYVVVPNARVPVWHGLVGAVVAALLVELAKRGFTFYLQQIETYELLYGAFAAIPIFFLWLYLLWIIVLFGAEIAHGLSAHYAWREGKSLDPLSHALAWLEKFWRAQQQGGSLSVAALIDSENYRYQLDPESLLAHMHEVQLLQLTAEGEYMLAKDLSHMTLAELDQTLPWKWPNVTQVSDYGLPIQAKWEGLLGNVQTACGTILVQPVSQLFAGDKRSERDPG